MCFPLHKFELLFLVFIENVCPALDLLCNEQLHV